MKQFLSIFFAVLLAGLIVLGVAAYLVRQENIIIHDEITSAKATITTSSANIVTAIKNFKLFGTKK